MSPKDFTFYVNYGIIKLTLTSKKTNILIERIHNIAQKTITSLESKMRKVIELSEYLEAQAKVLRNLHIEEAQKLNFQEDAHVKALRKVDETMEYFHLYVHPEKRAVEIEFFDDFNGNILTGEVDINSQMFCFGFMTFMNTLTYRIMAALQFYNPNGWCFNELWKTRQKLKMLTTDIFGFYADCKD